MCLLCQKSLEIASHRSSAKRKQETAAAKMIESSAKPFKVASIGDTVLIPTPDVDRCKIDPIVVSNFVYEGVATIC